MDNSVKINEFEEIAPSLKDCRFGSYIILSLKFDNGSINISNIERVAKSYKSNTVDLNENIKQRFAENGFNSIKRTDIGCAYAMDADAVNSIIGNGYSKFRTDSENAYEFQFTNSFIYLFHSQVAFLCLGIIYDDMRALEEIIHPGYAGGNSGILAFSDGEWIQFDLEKQLYRMFSDFGLVSFFSGNNYILLDSFSFNVCVMPKRFRDLETVRQITFNMQQMAQIDVENVDESADDIRYVYAAKAHDLGTYRWGCCISSQTISYAVADSSIDIDHAMEVYGRASIPISILALYEKYTCLRFDDYIKEEWFKSPKKMKRLKNMMLEFRAYGTIKPANISRWDNIRKIYKYLLEVAETESAIEDISNKVDVLTSHQDSIVQSRTDTIAWVVTAFGIISIVASVLSIIQILSSGSMLEWTTTAFTVIAICLILIGTLLRNRKN